MHSLNKSSSKQKFSFSKANRFLPPVKPLYLILDADVSNRFTIYLTQNKDVHALSEQEIKLRWRTIKRISLLRTDTKSRESFNKHFSAKKEDFRLGTVGKRLLEDHSLILNAPSQYRVQGNTQQAQLFIILVQLLNQGSQITAMTRL